MSSNIVNGVKKETGCLLFFENAFLMMKERAPFFRVNILTMRLLSEYFVVCKTMPWVVVNILILNFKFYINYPVSLRETPLQILKGICLPPPFSLLLSSFLLHKQKLRHSPLFSGLAGSHHKIYTCGGAFAAKIFAVPNQLSTIRIALPH